MYLVLTRMYGRKLLSLTNSSSQLDGFGSQLQRVLSVAAFANHTKIEFFFTRLKKIELQHGDFIHQPLNLNEYLDRCNKWILDLITNATLLSTKDIKSRKANSLKSINFQILIEILFRFKSRSKLCFELEDVYCFLNNSPDLYTSVTSARHSLIVRDDKSTYSIGLHVRLAAMLSGTERFLDPEIIIQFLREIKLWSDYQKIKPNVFIFTDITLGRVDPSYIETQVSQETKRLWREMGVIDDSGSFDHDLLSQLGGFLNKLYEIFPDLIVKDKLEVVEVLDEVVKMDLFIGSKSSFSFLLGLLASKSEVLMPIYWINPLSHWYNYKDLEDSRVVIRTILTKFI